MPLLTAFFCSLAFAASWFEGVQVLGIDTCDFAKAIELQRTHGLLTNDSLNLAISLRNGVTYLATADRQFDAVPGITVFRPDDLQP